MLTAFACVDGRVDRILAHGAAALDAAHWIDLVDATDEEAKLVEQATGLHVAKYAELSEIERSSRLATRNGALYLSMPMLVRPEDTDRRARPLGFVLTRDRIITIRFGASPVFDAFIARITEADPAFDSPAALLVSLLETMVDRLADLLEQLQADLDQASVRLFREELGGKLAPRRENEALRNMLQIVGRSGDFLSRIRDSLLGVGRIVPYVAHGAAAWLSDELRSRLETLRQDVVSLNDYDAHLANKVQFLLDATLGFINTAQNNIIKVLTVVSVVGIPPTLVASIYGMNFKDMPELNWTYGYPYGLTLIVITALAPLVWFRIKGWI
jgi:magnesium transporter